MGKFPNIWKLNNIHLNKQWIKEEITREIREYFEINENKTQHIKTCTLKQYLRGNLLLLIAILKIKNYL